ncbi:lipopolysaccharide biosynthesis protein [Flavobacterium tructae]|uniref:lipopolysaccharide biosynthesis protein n=1 Tax=Flavobacterium tructae TaxID=1114873 RepID=UPI0035A8D12F
MKNNILSLFFKFSFGGLISAAISFFTTPIITAIILPNEFGKASMFVLAFNFLLQFFLLGSDQSFVRFFHQENFRNNQSSLLFNAIFGPLVAFFCSLFVIFLFWKPISMFLIGEANLKLIILLVLTLLLAIIERFSTLLIRMSQQATLFSNLKIVQSIVNAFVIIFHARYIEASFFSIIYGTVISLFLVAIIGIICERKFWLKKMKIDKVTIKEIVNYGLPFIPTFIISWIFEGIDKIALRYYSNFAEIGLYTAATKIVAILTVLQVTFSNFWVPIAYEAYEGSSAKTKKLFENAFLALSVLFFTGAIMIVAFKNVIIKLFDKDYLQAAEIMPFLIFMPVMYTLSEITAGGINFKKRTYWHLFISIICMLVNCIGVFFLVPILGAKGAAISTGMAYIVFFYLRTLISNSLFPLNFHIALTSIAIFLLLIVVFINSFSKDTLLCYIIDFCALVVILSLYKNKLIVIYNDYRLNRYK